MEGSPSRSWSWSRARRRAGEGPTTGASRRRPATRAAAQPPTWHLGAEVYASSCAACHGADLRGTGQGPSHLSIVYEPGHHPDEAFRAAILRGSPQHHWDFGDMAPVTGLDEAEIDAVIAYIRDVQQREGFEE